jgi:hypothetical protein
MSRDHSTDCSKCGFATGGINSFLCQCEKVLATQNHDSQWTISKEQADAVYKLLDALIYPKRNITESWEQACLHWGRFGETPARIALLEAAVLEACDMASVSKKNSKKRILELVSLAKLK